jgi:type III pantothenate kinase
MSARILIDVGNTRLKWAQVTARGAIREQGALSTDRVTSRWAAAFARQHTGARVVTASVVPAVSTILRRAVPPLALVSDALPGLPLAFAYPKPAEIGADRIAAAIGAGSAAPAIILSCGTATAISVLDAKGRFCGGAILPGIQTQLHALASGTAQLPLTGVASTPRALGKSTQAAIRAGVLVGWQGGVVEIVTRLRREIGPRTRVLVTGGEARHLRGVRGLGRAEFRPLLVFEGLRIIADALSDR